MLKMDAIMLRAWNYNWMYGHDRPLSQQLYLIRLKC